jgi:MFS family permease
VNAPNRPAPLLLQRNFAALWSGQLVSILGDRLTYLALVGLLAEHTREFRDARSSLLLSLLANVMLAPVLLFSPFTGAWVDRWNLRRTLIVSDLIRSGLVFLIPTLYLFSHYTAPTFALVFLLFTCNVFFLPAKSAITPEIVPASQLLAANALLSAAGVVATAVGAICGGWIVDHLGWAMAMRIDAVTYLFSVLTLALIAYRPSAQRRTPPSITWSTYLSEVRDGLRSVRASSRVGLALTALAAVWVGGGFLHVAGNLHIQRAASVPGMERLGLLMAALGLGSGLGTWWVNGPGRRVPQPWLLGGGLLLVSLGLIAFAVSSRFAVFASAGFIVGLAAAPAFVLSETLIQEGTELHQRGRVFSMRDFLMRLLFLIAVTLAGALTRSFGTEPALLVCSAMVAASGLISIYWGRHDPSLLKRN